MGHLLDMVIIIIAGICAYIGWRQGLIRAAFSIVGLIVGIMLAGQLADDLAEKISGAQWAYFATFAIILIGLLVIANIIGRILEQFTKFAIIGWLDSLGGMLSGLFIGAIAIAAILASAGAWADSLRENGNEIVEAVKQGMSEAIGDSFLAELLIYKFRLVLALLPGNFDAIQKFFE